MVLFVLRLPMYSLLYAALGSLVSRQEDVQSATSPLMMLIMVGYFMSVFGLQAIDETWVKVASFVPFFSPYLMLGRVSAGHVEAWEFGLAVAAAGDQHRRGAGRGGPDLQRRRAPLRPAGAGQILRRPGFADRGGSLAYARPADGPQSSKRQALDQRQDGPRGDRRPVQGRRAGGISPGWWASSAIGRCAGRAGTGCAGDGP